MRRVVPIVLAVMAACGGPQIPMHSGYKSEKSTPWTKAKPIKLNDKFEGKVDDGTLNYAKFQRAKWYEVDLNAHGDLDVNLDVTPPGDGTNEDFDLAIEILDPGYRVISKSDLEDTDDAGNLQKKKQLKDLTPGKYLIHLYLQSRMDSAEFSLKVAFHPTSAGEAKSDFPAQVMFTPILAQVPMKDDAPPDWKPTPPVKPPTGKPQPRPTGNTPKPPPKDPPKDPPKVTAVSARILAVAIVGGGTQITVARGTETGAAVGMKVSLKGISGSLAACNARTCTAVLTATPDQIKNAGSDVTLSP
ncbi:MAG: hypothetical protein NT062_20830 [Proteobacteria bacterium]|nr:hypothetical protein [Pseudomonadota bacterium]